MHYSYSRWARYGDPLTVTKPRGIRSVCSLTDCDDVVEGYGYCRKHYKRWRKHGDPAITRQRRQGYILLYQPDPPNARADGYILEHRLVLS